MPDKYYVRRPFDYAGEELDRGRIVELRGARNDEKLVRLGYLAPVEKFMERRQCGVCNQVFVDEGSRNGHGEMRHSDRFHGMTLAEREAAMEEEVDREEKKLERIAPLYLDKTEASRAAGEDKIEVNTTTPETRAAQKKAKGQAGRARPAPQPRAGRIVQSAGR